MTNEQTMTHPRGWTGKEGMAGTLFCGTDGMNDIAAIFGRMEANCLAPSSTSRKLWQLRRATTIRPDNARSETMLEKAVAMLAKNGHMPGWFNQCPTASGIGDSSRTRHNNIDLVRWSEADRHALLVELKWGSDSPSSAVRQILRYGAAYVFCRLHRSRLPIQRRPLMDARDVTLLVVAPASYCREPNLPDCLSTAREALKRFDVGSRIEGLSMSLDVRAFPEWFDRLPFSSGAQVSASCDQAELTETGRKIRDAIDGLTSVCPELNGQGE